MSFTPAGLRVEPNVLRSSLAGGWIAPNSARFLLPGPSAKQPNALPALLHADRALLLRSVVFTYQELRVLESLRMSSAAWSVVHHHHSAHTTEPKLIAPASPPDQLLRVCPAPPRRDQGRYQEPL
jgi:hypothetical protein